MARSIGNKQEEAKFKEEIYEQLWIIPDWDRIQQSEDTLLAQRFEFNTEKSTRVQTKWTVGFELKNQPNRFSAFWKLVEVKGFPDGGIKATAVWTLLKGNSTDELTDSQNVVLNIGEKVEVPVEVSLKQSLNYWGVNINPNGELVCKLKLAIMEPIVPFVEFRMNRFHKVCAVQVGRNLASLIGDEASADLIIMTNDGKKLFAHKLILKAQCPVFETMFRSGLSESKTGIVNVKDVNAKTMEILLHFFYSGELLPSWKDTDTIVEFTYAVSKYQLNDVLTMLDDVLGSRDEEEATYKDVQLLKLAQRLDLKIAEQELMERIRKTLCKVTKGTEFLALWDIEKK